jgi:hypothetical protein
MRIRNLKPKRKAPVDFVYRFALRPAPFQVLRSYSHGENAAEDRRRWKKIRPAPFKKFSDPFLARRRGNVQRKTALGSKTAIPRLQGFRRVCGNLDPENVPQIEVTRSLPAGWMGPADRHADSSYGAGAFIFRVPACARN